MKTAAVIAEFNPLHRGHEYLLKKIKTETDADRLIVLMSGDFVQRGEPAVIDKYRRARTALEAGADLVLELPVCYALAPAEVFARGAVITLNAAGAVDELVFGSEAGELEGLKRLASVLNGAPSDCKNETSESEGPAACDKRLGSSIISGMKSGASYPTALENAVKELYPDEAELAGLLRDAPNNTLGVEYLRSLELTRSIIKPATIRRTECDGIKSAAEIREMLAASLNDQRSGSGCQKAVLDEAGKHMPAYSCRELMEVLSSDSERPVFSDDLTETLKYRLATVTEAELGAIGDIGSDLADRIINNRYGCDSFSEFSFLLKNRSVTMARIHRSLLQLILDIRRDDRDAMLAAGCTALRVLGFRETGRELLSELGRKATAPVIVRGADLSGIEDPLTQKLVDIDLRAAAIYDQFSKKASVRRPEASRMPVIL